MSANYAVFVTVLSTVNGTRGASDIVCDWVDKGLVRSSEGFDSGPQVSVYGMEEVLRGAMEDELRSRWWWITWWAGLGMKRERVFVGKEKQREVGNGHVGAWAGVSNGECIAEVTWKVVESSCGERLGSKYPGRTCVISERRWNWTL